MAKKILWNEEAVKQGADEFDPDDLNCPECETTPQLRKSHCRYRRLSRHGKRLRPPVPIAGKGIVCLPADATLVDDCVACYSSYASAFVGESKEKRMARKTVLVSDESGQEIPDGKGARVRIIFNDARKGVRELDLTDAEAEKLGGRPVARRGRKPKSAS